MPFVEISTNSTWWFCYTLCIYCILSLLPSCFVLNENETYGAYLVSSGSMRDFPFSVWFHKREDAQKEKLTKQGVSLSLDLSNNLSFSLSFSCSSWTSIYDPAGSWIFVFSKDNRTIRNEIHIKYGWNGIFGFFLLTRHVIAIWLLVLFLFSWYYNCVLSLSNLLRCFILCQYAIAKTFMWREDNTQKG